MDGWMLQVGDLRVLQRQLREKLLLQLRSAIQLPKCLQVSEEEAGGCWLVLGLLTGY